jgi:hypothetical protein
MHKSWGPRRPGEKKVCSVVPNLLVPVLEIHILLLAPVILKLFQIFIAGACNFEVVPDFYCWRL